MKKILSVILVLSMVLALGVTAFAAEYDVEVGDTLALTLPIASTEDGVKVVDANGFLTVDKLVIGENFIAFELTAPAGTAGKLAKVIITDETKDANVLHDPIYVNITKPEEEEPEVEEVIEVGELLVAVSDNKATVDMGAYNGISAEAYNSLKNKNYETITFEGDDYTWTLTRGDYTKMNVSASIYFGVDVDTKLYMVDENDIDEDGDKKEIVEDKASENAVLKALGTTQADVFYVDIADNCNIANVASKPALVVKVPASWINYSNKFSVNAYKFDGETATKVVEGLAVKPATNKLTLNLTTAGTYVFVADNYTVNPTPSTGSTEKPNASTGANSAAAVVALAVMAVAAVASKKIVK